ncbi:MAG: hypothetical protein JWP85_990 [Rhodoglobus sp.]|nr:hypothetical protein [Rhodoglobus sp.]
MSARKQLAAALKTALPKVTVLDVEDMPDALSKPTLIVRFHDYTPAPNAQGSTFAGFVVTIASHHTDRDKAEDALDALLADVLPAVLNFPTATWTRCNKALLGQYLAFDIDVTLLVDVL